MLIFSYKSLIKKYDLSAPEAKRVWVGAHRKSLLNFWLMLYVIVGLSGFVAVCFGSTLKIGPYLLTVIVIGFLIMNNFIRERNIRKMIKDQKHAKKGQP